jgi:hypothetical protein
MGSIPLKKCWERGCCVLEDFVVLPAQVWGSCVLGSSAMCDCIGFCPIFHKLVGGNSLFSIT